VSVSEDAARIGTELLGYRIEALVGRGGMGVVYRAYDPRLKRNVALKLIAPELSGDPRFRERFLVETELAASLEHPNVVPVHDAGEVEGQLYLVMRYVEGGELKTLLEREGALEPAHALAICGQVAAALDAAHGRGLVHRDVKPSNVLLDESEHVYLADFGLSRRLADVTGAGEERFSVGTPAYVSPEQIKGGDVDGRADVYALGCVLHECLTGEPPYSRDSELALLWAHLQEPSPKPSERNPALASGIDAVVATALAKSTDDRYATCGELIGAAREALGAEQASPRGLSRRTIGIAAAGVVIALAALAGGLTLALGDGGNARAKPNLAVKTNTLVRIDPKTNKIADVIPVGRNPESLAYGGHTAWVYNYADRTVEGIDARTNAIVVPSTAISGDPPTEAGIFREVAADQEGAWVLSVQAPSGRGWLTHVRRDVPSTDQIQLPATPVAIAFGDGAIWVTTTKGRTGALLRIDRRTRAVKTLRLPGLDATPNWIAVGAGAVWLTDAAADASLPDSEAISGVPDSRLFRIDPRTMRITGERGIRCHQAMCSVAIGPGSVSIVENPWSGPFRVLRVDPGTLRKIGLIATPRSVLNTVFFGGFGFVGLDGNTIWYVGDGAVRVDALTSRIVARIHLLDYTSGFALPSASVTGGGSVWITVAAPR
jgi:serine/threonine-protein kinase